MKLSTRSQHPLPRSLYRSDQVRELDRIAIEEHGIPGFTLMRRAGKAAFACLLKQWPDTKSVSIFCGGGNNGGDGYIIAGLALQQGMLVQLVNFTDGSQLLGDAREAWALAMEQGVECEPYNDDLSIDGDVIVDALLGTGLNGPVRGFYYEAVEIINDSAKPVLAVDIPSGLCSDTGQVLGICTKAQCTVTFIAIKQGLLTADGPHYSGELVYDDLLVPEGIFAELKPAAQLIDWQLSGSLLPPRHRVSHKGNFGHVLIIGGDYGMPGAAILAAEAAARVGAGLVSVATRKEHMSVVVARRPEVMVHGIDDKQDLGPLLAKVNSVVIGPGLGTSQWSEHLLRQLLMPIVGADLSLVLDADALNILSSEPFESYQQHNPWILTPHPGEAARLLESDTTKIQQNRFLAAEQIQHRYGGVVVVKGAGSLVCYSEQQEQTVDICAEGNPGMSSGGMGDVLSGLLGGLLAQGLSIKDAARLGVCIHARSGDLAAQHMGERGLLATDLFTYLQELVNPT